MEQKNLKHIAVIEANSKGELLKKLNEAIDKYGLNIVHYEISQEANLNDQFEEV